MTDYRQLCKELFGTDDEKELKAIAVKVNYNRGAGRKKKLNADDEKKIKAMLEKNISINEIAQKLGTTRQLISRYVNAPPESHFTLRLIYMYRQFPCTNIDVDFMSKKIEIQNRTDDIIHRAFGLVENPDWEQFEEFLRLRCFSENRGNKKEILRELGISSYDTLQIIEKTQGRISDDDMWIKLKYYPRQVGI